MKSLHSPVSAFAFLLAIESCLFASLPPGVKAVWDLNKAHRESTPTREKVCLNGLWQWQPGEAAAQQVPTGNWGYFKVPGCWPGITDYMQKDCQTVFAAPAWEKQRLAGIGAAWYQRQFTVPAAWSGRRISLRLEYLNSYAAVHINGSRVGEVYFPGGEVEVTTSCNPGATNLLSLLVIAMPLKGVMLSYTDSASAREVKGSVARRGLCGDVYLVSTPGGPRVQDVKVNPSVRKRACTFDIALTSLKPNTTYSLNARVADQADQRKVFTSPEFQAHELKAGRFSFTAKWFPDKLWNIHTPSNICKVEVSLLEGLDAVLDTYWTERFGFRELWIEGRDFCLNGSRVFLSALPLDNAQVSAGLATYAAARESLQRLQSFGINFVYTHNYGCEPGSHLGFQEILRAADDVGMLVSFSQPHFSHYDWQAGDADEHNGYARHAEYYVRAAQNHPSVVMYSMSHNATGYEEDMNPDLIDGIHDPRNSWSQRNAALALRAEKIAGRLDPSRMVYHHASGNLGTMHPINFYPNFVPVQELSDWFEHWATEGVKPVFTCEYGAPFTWDWTMYRGWYKGQREFGSAAVPWEFCLAEWNAQFFGDRAFQISEPEKANLRWEARQFRDGKLWHRWDYPNEVGSSRFTERYPVFALYLQDNWRAFRTWGVSAVSPWEHGHFWKVRDGVQRGRRELHVDWEHLQRPGFSPDYVDQRYERMDLAFERSDWLPTAAAEALLRNNRPLLAYVAGKPARFTSKDHNFLPGDLVEKQLILINNSRETVTCDCRWSVDLPQTPGGREAVTLRAGQQQRLPLRFEIPASISAGSCELRAEFSFDNGEVQKDSFTIHILPQRKPAPVQGKVALYDPEGQTGSLLHRLGVATEPVQANTDLTGYDVLIIGKSSLKVAQPSPNLRQVREGLKVLCFEQTPDVLEKRLGFRVAEYGLRQVFERIPDHPVLAGLEPQNLRDWRGEATLLPPRLKYELRPRYGPTVQWCGLPVTRLWRCGNRGNVGSVLIEKPPRGEFLPILDGGFSLQYCPLLEYRAGKGLVVFCQADVTGRTESEPAAEILTRNLLQYVANWKPPPRREAVYAGVPAGAKFLQDIGIRVSPLEEWLGSAGTAAVAFRLPMSKVLVVGPGGGKALSSARTELSHWLNAGGNLLALGLDQTDAAQFLPVPVSMKSSEHISTFFEPFDFNSLLTGISPADLHNRDPRNVPLVSGGAQIVGNGVLALGQNANVVFCQVTPWDFAPAKTMNLKRTQRRVSFLVSRLLSNLGLAGSTPLLERFHAPAAPDEKRWLEGLYLDTPEEWDDPYRFFRW